MTNEKNSFAGVMRKFHAECDRRGLKYTYALIEAVRGWMAGQVVRRGK